MSGLHPIFLEEEWVLYPRLYLPGLTLLPDHLPFEPSSALGCCYYLLL